MGSSSRKKIYKLNQRLKLRNEKSAADRKGVEALLTRIVRMKAKQNKSVKATEKRMVERKERLAYVRAERDRGKQIKAAQRAGIRNERLREKHFTNRTSFKHVVYSMAEAQPNKIYRYYLGLCSFVHLTKALRSLGAPLEGDFRTHRFTCTTVKFSCKETGRPFRFAALMANRRTCPWRRLSRSALRRRA